MSFHPSRHSFHRSALLVLSAAVLAAAVTSGCTASPETPDPVSATGAGTASAAAGPSAGSPDGTSDQAASLSIAHPWVKATEGAMTGAFGSLTNSGTEDLQVVAASSPQAASVELHETVQQADGTAAMAESGGGFTIPAGETFLLEPGANHLMLMGLEKPVLAGEEISFTLTLSDGSTVEFTAPAKDFAGANESYHGG
ncbi:copper chaperone PCu(A)C [Arthrobacter sp. zg-ZUI100]|uniref:copper chaperone PCu(A)C n=1 Tax=Arthrobacter jiangjiafuii TaxID=2817475 RepID=UPI001AEEC66F|nr:copper chaperone PCu(A)C [Arthrobacter jiangjiafuii]MBP3035189.1 copper chaperone PCu(A)C [Arthrobacter jiangjiafuii]